MRGTFYYIVLFLIVIENLQSQNLVSGKVFNEQNEGIPFVTIRLLQMDSLFVAGCVSDSIGNFTFNQVENGDYLLAFSSIGYESKEVLFSIRDEKPKPLSIILREQKLYIEDLVITASSFVRQKDKILIYPDKQQMKHASTGYDVLYNLMIPSIDVNKRTGSVTAFGGTVTLYIDGEKANFRDVMNLRPRDIENIEYYDVPTGKYANDIAAINYITKNINREGILH